MSGTVSKAVCISCEKSFSLAGAVLAKCPVCGGDMVPISAPADDVVRSDLTVISGAQMAAHIAAAGAVAIEMAHQFERPDIKPYDLALAHALSLYSICMRMGWKPQEVVATIAALRGDL